MMFTPRYLLLLARQRDELLEKESGFERQDEGEFPL